MERPHGVRWLLRLLSCIRFDEVLVLQGAPVLGAIFSISRLDSHSAMAFLLLVAGNCLLVAHVFLLNDWAGVHGDLQDPSRVERVFLNRGISRNEIAGLTLALLLLGLVLFAWLGWVSLILGLMIAIASALYSAPAFYLKGTPLLNSLLHLVSGVLHFLLGYSAFSAVDVRGIAIGCFFALVFSAGHLTHEVRDFDADLRNDIKTNAVHFGKTRSFIVGFALFTVADALLIALSIKGVVPPALILVAALYPLHCYWSLQAMREGLTYQSVRRLQARYRTLYSGIGALMVISLLLA